MEKESGLLFVDCCIRPESHTRVLAQHVIKGLGGQYKKVSVVAQKCKPLDFTLLKKRTQKIKTGDYSDKMFDLAKQFAESETIVIAAPFWDLSFPSFLKIYLENILVPGLTFTYKNGKPQGMCRAKKLYYITTAGGEITCDFGFSYVKALAENFFGIQDIVCFKAEGFDIEGNDANIIIKKAVEQIRHKMQ